MSPVKPQTSHSGLQETRTGPWRYQRPRAHFPRPGRDGRLWHYLDYASYVPALPRDASRPNSRVLSCARTRRGAHASVAVRAANVLRGSRV